MAAPQIPHLSTLRKPESSRRRPAESSRNPANRKSKDEIIQNTDNDAAMSRLSAVDAGYLDDPFAKLLTPEPVQRRLPLMNRGTYVRTVGIDRVVDTFITSGPGRKQIISLGAGSDTRYFRLRRKHDNLNLIYHELDFEANTRMKVDRIQTVEFAEKVHQLCSLDVNDYQISNGSLRSADYYVCPQDLRTLPEKMPGLELEVPTLVISECCLIYLSPEEADNVLQYFTGLFSNAPLAIVIYEPIRPADAFGKTMVRNLIARGIQLQTLEMFADLDQQRKRLQVHAFESRAEDIDFIWRSWVEEEERERVSNLEWMDEVEEFVLLAKHYCLSWGWKGWSQDNEWRTLRGTV